EKNRKKARAVARRASRCPRCCPSWSPRPGPAASWRPAFLVQQHRGPVGPPVRQDQVEAAGGIESGEQHAGSAGGKSSRGTSAVSEDGAGGSAKSRAWVAWALKSRIEPTMRPKADRK